MESNRESRKIHPAAPAGGGGTGSFCRARPLGTGGDTLESSTSGLYPFRGTSLPGRTLSGSTIIVPAEKTERLAKALRLAIPKLPENVRAKVESLLTPEALGMLVGLTIIWAGSHFFGVGEGVDLVLIGVGVYFLGWDAIQAGRDFVDFVQTAVEARSEQDLERAADHFARAVATIGVDAMLVLVARLGSKAKNGRSFRKSGEPAQSGETRIDGVGVRTRVSAVDTKTPASQAIPSQGSILSAHEANARHIAAGRRPPYAPGTNVKVITLQEPMELVRVHGPGNKKGAWLMRPEDIKGLSPLQIQQKFALPEVPTQVSTVRVPDGTTIRVGEAASQRGWGEGGGTQFELMDRVPDSAFQNTRPLQ